MAQDRSCNIGERTTYESSPSINQLFQPDSDLIELAIQNQNESQFALFEWLVQVHEEIVGLNEHNMLFYSARKMAQSMENSNVQCNNYDNLEENNRTEDDGNSTSTQTNTPIELLQRYMNILEKEKHIYKSNRSARRPHASSYRLLEVKIDSLVVLVTIILRGATSYETIKHMYGHFVTVYLANLVGDILQAQSLLNYNHIFENNNIKEITALVSRMQITHRLSRRLAHFVYLHDELPYLSQPDPSIPRDGIDSSEKLLPSLKERLSRLLPQIINTLGSYLNILPSCGVKRNVNLYVCAMEELSLIWSIEVLEELGSYYKRRISYSLVPYMYNLAYEIATRAMLHTFYSESNHKLGQTFLEELIKNSDSKDPILSYSILLNVFLSDFQYTKNNKPDKIEHGRNIFARLPDLPAYNYFDLFKPTAYTSVLHEDLIHLSKIQLMESSPPVTFVSNSFVAIISWLIGPPPSNSCQYLDKSPADFYCSLKHVHDSTSSNHNPRPGQLGSKQLGHNLNYLIFYSCWESLRFCFLSKLKTPYGSVKDLLSHLQSSLDGRYAKRITSTQSQELDNHHNELFSPNVDRKMFLLIFDLFEKLLVHALEHSANDLFQMDDSTRAFYLSNEKPLANILSCNRSKLSRLALDSQSYADAWHHACMSLYRSKSESKVDVDSILVDDARGSFKTSLKDLFDAAKGLGDVDLLYGIDTYVSENLPGFMPSSKLEIWNMECRYEDTLELADEFVSGIFAVDYVDFDQAMQDSILKLAADAAISLGQFQGAHKYVDKIKNDGDKLIYDRLLKLLSLAKSPILGETFARTNYDVVKTWLNTWEKEECASKDVSLAINGIERQYPFDLSQHLLATIARTSYGLNGHQKESLLKDVCLELEKISFSHALFHPSHHDNKLKLSYLLANLIGNNHDENPIELSSLVKRKMDDESTLSLYNHLCYYHDILKLSDGLNNEKFLTQLIYSKNMLRLKVIDLHRRRGNVESWRRLINQGLSELEGPSDGSNIVTQQTGSNLITEQLNLIRSRFFYEKILISEKPRFAELLELFGTLQSNKLHATSLPIRMEVKDMLVKVMITLAGELYSEDKSGLAERYDVIKLIQDKIGNHVEGSTNLFHLFEETLEAEPTLQPTKVKILEALSSWVHTQRRRPNSNQSILETAFDIDLKLLVALESCKTEGKSKKITSTNCALRILSMIQERGLNDRNRSAFQDENFISETLSVWTQLANQLLSTTMKKIVIEKREIQDHWQDYLFSILKRISVSSPQTLIYPVIVGHLDLVESLQDLAEQTCSAEQSDYLKQTVLKRWLELKQILQRSSAMLKDNNLEILGETEKFIKELRKITSLWGEHLFNVSGRIMQRIQNLLRSLHELKSPSDANKNVNDEKQTKMAVEKWQSLIDYSIGLMKTIMTFIERQSQQTLSSRYEMWFCDTFSKTLIDIMAKLDQINTSLTEPSGFDPFSESNLSLLINIGSLFNYCRQVVHEYNRINRNKLYMEVISPTLSRLDSSDILMPACSSSGIHYQHPIFVCKVKQVIRILISKTCPKKLTLLGSDGRYRSFILKGHEDLRLDKHIMQLFALINRILFKNKLTRYRYSLRHYAVTPLSTRSGLIQWIDASPIYSFYRTWLAGNTIKQRIEYQHKQQKLSKQASLKLEPSIKSNAQFDNINTASDFLPPPAQPLRPHELFYTKLTELGNQGVAKILCINYMNVDRKKWNTQLLVKVLVELEKETPDDLIANHLWFKSINAHEHWTKKQTFIHSCSVMSMVGYIIGLGDRHMDNILIDSSGELIHIDYNMSFDMARTWLRVPEQVPFRLTQNFVRAFGFAGLEGGFTRSCQRVLSVLKENKQTLLHLLDPIYWEFIIESDEKNVKVTQKCAESKFSNDDAAKGEKDVDAYETSDLEAKEKDVALVKMIERENKITSAILENNKLASQNVDYQDGFDLSQTLNMQRCIKTPTRLTKNQALEEFSAIESKLDGNDELVSSYHYQRTTSKKKPGPSTGDTPDLIGLVDAHTTEEQVEALIHAATSSVNKARMYEGWTPWV